MKSLDKHILCVKAQINALRFLCSGAASAEMVQVASRRWEDLEKELKKLEEMDAKQGELTLHSEAA